MNAAQLAFFKKRLLQLHSTTKARIQEARIQEARDQMASPPEFDDESDRAS